MSFRTSLQSLRHALQAPVPSTSRCSCLPSSSRPFSSSPRSLAVLPPPASPWTLPKGLELKGQVTSVGKMQQTITVSVERRVIDHKTLKPSSWLLNSVRVIQEFSKHTKFLVHDPSEQCVVGDQVKIRNCRPISARKRFELVSIIKGARERVESHHGAGAAATETSA
ncbi:SPOSA6832_03638, partial [Sporobolomyces salmonicolor]